MVSARRKVDKGETSIQSLQREIKEELNIDLEPKLIKYYGHIQAPAFGENSNVIMKQDCYLYPYNQEIVPNNEIEEVKYFDLVSYYKEAVQVVGVIEVFNWLAKDKLL